MSTYSAAADAPGPHTPAGAEGQGSYLRQEDTQHTEASGWAENAGFGGGLLGDRILNAGFGMGQEMGAPRGLLFSRQT